MLLSRLRLKDLIYRLIGVVLLFVAGHTSAKGQEAFEISQLEKLRGFRITDMDIYSNAIKLPIDSVLFNQSNFILNPTNRQYKAVSSDRYNWFRFKLRNSSNDTISFKLINGNNQINEMELFKLTGNAAISFGKTGRLFPFYQRPYPFLHFTYPLSLKPHEEATYIFFADCRGISYRVMNFVFSNTAFKKGEQRIYLTYGFFAGILLLSSLFNIFLFLVNREKVYFAYSLYSLSVIFSVCALQSFDVQYLYPNFPHYTRTAITTFTSITCILMLWVMQLFLKLNPLNSRLFIATKIMQWFCALVPFFAFYVINFSTSYPLVRIYLTLYPLMLSSTLVLVLLCCIERLIQGYKLAIFYLVAVSFVLISGALMAIGVFERKYYLKLPPTLYDISMVAEALIICFGILFRYLLIKREKEKLEKEFREHQVSVNKQLHRAQEYERKRIAEDLHDELGSSLAALKLRIQKTGLEQPVLKEIIEVVDKASADARNISHNLMPPEFEKTSLEQLLSAYYSKLNSESNLRFNFFISGSNSYFSKENELMIYRIIMELTGNILKHSDASDATIQLIYYENQLEIMVEDNGIGFKANNNDGIGLKNIQSRVNYLNGSLKIDSNNAGTTLMIQIPYKNTNDAR